MKIFKIKRSINIKKNTISTSIYLFNKIKLLKIKKKLDRKAEIFNPLDTLTFKDKQRKYVNDANSNLVSELTKLESFDYHANGGNLGDFLIAQSEYKLFEKLQLNYRIYKRTDTIEVQPNLVIGGGGGFVSYWNYQTLFPLLSNKNIKNILILPSSFLNVMIL